MGDNYEVTRLAASLEGPLHVKTTLALVLYWMRSVGLHGFLVNDGSAGVANEGEMMETKYEQYLFDSQFLTGQKVLAE